MKLIHTSDWHLGMQLHARDRREEHEAMLRELTALVAREQPDAFLLSGDIYDVAQPPIFAQQLFIRAMLALHEACPTMSIICTSGNHDSGARHEIHKPLWESHHTTLVGTVDAEHPEQLIVPIQASADAPVKGYVAAVPYVHPHFLPDDFYARLGECVQIKNQEQLPVVMMNHLAVESTRCDYTGHALLYDRYIGGIECADIAAMDAHYDYIALGHIHKAQTISTSPLTRYAGSPVAVSFDEVRPSYEHGVSVVTIPEHGGKVEVRHEELTPLRPLVNLPQDDFLPWEDCLALLRAFPSDIPAYIRLNVLLEDNAFLPADRDEQIREALQGKEAECLTANPKRKVSDTASSLTSAAVLSGDAFREVQAVDIARRWVEQKGGVFTEEMEIMFAEAHRLALEGKEALV